MWFVFWFSPQRLCYLGGKHSIHNQPGADSKSHVVTYQYLDIHWLSALLCGFSPTLSNSQRLLFLIHLARKTEPSRYLVHQPTTLCSCVNGANVRLCGERKQKEKK